MTSNIEVKKGSLEASAYFFSVFGLNFHDKTTQNAFTKRKSNYFPSLLQLPGCSSHNAMRPCHGKLIRRDDVKAVKRLVNFEDRNISLFPLNVTGLFLYKFLTRTVMSTGPDSKRCNLNVIL